MTPRDLAVRALPAVGGWLALASLALPDASPPRGAVVVAFLALGPGAALTGICGPVLSAHRAEGPVARRDADFERRSDLLERLMLAVLLSVSAAMLVATVLFATHLFSGPRTLLALTLLTTLAVLCPRLTASPARRGARRTARRTAPGTGRRTGSPAGRTVRRSRRRTARRTAPPEEPGAHSGSAL